jgi:P pilus assembly chaperone PapD
MTPSFLPELQISETKKHPTQNKKQLDTVNRVTILFLPDKKATSSKTVPKALFLDTKRSLISFTNLE